MTKTKIFIWLSLTVFGWQNIIASKPDNINIGIAAVVNNYMISKLQLKQRIKLAILSSNLPNTSQTENELQPQILNIMIDEAIQRQLGESFDLKIDQVLLDSSLNEIEIQNNMPSGELKILLKNNAIPLEIMYDHLKANLVWREYIRERFKDNVQVSEEEINRTLREFEIAKGTLRYNLFELVINYKDNKSDALQTMNKIISLFHKGTPFPNLAKQFSNSASASEGGHIGWISQNAIDSQNYAKIKNLQSNEISSIDDNGHSLTIYFVKDRLEPGQMDKSKTLLSFKQVLLPFSQNIQESEVKDNLQRARAMARTIKGCRVVDKIKQSNNVMVQSVENVSVQNLPPELSKILMDLPVDQASDPVVTPQGSLIFVLCEKVVTNPQEPTFEEVKEQLIERKLQLIADREMRNRRKSTHIERRI